MRGHVICEHEDAIRITHISRHAIAEASLSRLKQAIAEASLSCCNKIQNKKCTFLCVCWDGVGWGVGGGKLHYSRKFITIKLQATLQEASRGKLNVRSYRSRSKTSTRTNALGMRNCALNLEVSTYSKDELGRQEKLTSIRFWKQKAKTNELLTLLVKREHGSTDVTIIASSI